MNFRNSAAGGTTYAAGGTTQPPPFPEELTLRDLSEDKTYHSFNVDAAKKALFGFPVRPIQDVQNFLDGTSTPDQTNQLFLQLSTYAKEHGVGLAFHNQSKQVDIAVTDAGHVYTPTDGVNGKMTQVYPNSTGGEVDEAARVSGYGRSGQPIINAADRDATTDDLKPLNEMMDSEHMFVHKKKIGRVYASSEQFNVRHKLPGSGNQSTTTKYSYVVTRLHPTIGGGFLLVAKRP